ncbi:carboxypeptidase-like regulatory domain-containing protein [Deinococcus pimensis]|uniref:carboxypeptidase-like regulatory domain-containing protein n=1 Tax=Deinococcus pimensis TaxID=309888 RepID=UPI0012FCBDFD|nr:carboxypeptidase-like regulatory domain-containing protein [Deinococcus pimensis]
MKQLGLVMLITALSACGGAPTGDATGRTPPGETGSGESGQAGPYTMTGTVRSENGMPVPGVDVYADNTLSYNVNATGVSDTSGHYRLTLPRNELGTWRGGAILHREYHGINYQFVLVASDVTEFPAERGAVRDFTWKLSGRTPEGQYYGGSLWMYGAVDAPGFDLSRVEVTLEPDGPIIDGSAGRTIRAFLYGSQIRDIPIGRYKVTARYLPEDGPPQSVLIAERRPSTYASSMTADFERTNTLGNAMQFTIKLGASVQPGDATSSISGDVRAATDLKGAVVVACVMNGEVCDETTKQETTIETSGLSARYHLDDLMVGQPYTLYGWKDVNGDNVVNRGDLIGMFSDGAPGTTVTPPNASAGFSLKPMS